MELSLPFTQYFSSPKKKKKKSPPIPKILPPSFLPGAEELEPRIVQTATPTAIPPSLVGNPLIQQWTTEHRSLDTDIALVTRVQNDISSIQGLLSQYHGDADRWQTELTADEQKMGQALTNRDQLRQTLTDLTTMLQQLTTQRDTLQRPISGQSELQTLNATLATQQKQLTDTQTAVTQTQSSIQALQTDVTQKNAGIVTKDQDVAAKLALANQATVNLQKAQQNEPIAVANLNAARTLSTTAQTQFQKDATSYDQAVTQLNSATTNRNNINTLYQTGKATKTQLDAANALVTSATTLVQTALAAKTKSQTAFDASMKTVQAAGDAVGVAGAAIGAAATANNNAWNLYSQTLNDKNALIVGRDQSANQIPALQVKLTSLNAQLMTYQNAVNATKASIVAKSAPSPADQLTINSLNGKILTTQTQIANTNALLAPAEKAATDATTVRDTARNAHDAAMAQIAAEENLYSVKSSDLLFEQEQTVMEQSVVDALDTKVAARIASVLATPETLITNEPLQYSLKQEGPDSYSMTVTNLPTVDTVAFGRLVSRWDGNNHYQAYGYEKNASLPATDGTIWFNTASSAGIPYVDTILNIDILDASGTLLAKKTIDVRQITAAGTTPIVIPEVTVQKTKTVSTPSTFSALESAPSSPSVKVMLSGGKLTLRGDGLPAQATAIIHGPSQDFRDIVLPSGGGDLTVPGIDIAALINGQYTLQIVVRGQPVGQPLKIGPDSALSFSSLPRNATESSANTITQAPQMQMIQEGQSVGVRYQYLEEGSTFQITQTNNGAWMQNAQIWNFPLAGTQGTLQSLVSLPNATTYYIDILRPNGDTAGLGKTVRLDNPAGALALSDPQQSKTVQTTLPLASTAPMLWLGGLNNSTVGSSTFNGPAIMGQRILNITGLSISTDAAWNALKTLIQENMGIAPSYISPIPQSTRDAMTPKFTELYAAYQGTWADQSAAWARNQSTEAAGWKKRDDEILAALPTATSPLVAYLGTISDSAYESNKQTILAGHKNDADGGAALLQNFTVSVGRPKFTNEQLAVMTGKPVITLVAAMVPSQWTDTGATAGLDINIGYGSGELWDPKAYRNSIESTAAWNHLQSLLTISNVVPGATGSSAIMTDSMLGYLAAGVLQEAGRNTAAQNLISLSHDLATITGITERQILVALQKTDVNDRANALLLTLWNQGFSGVRLAEQLAAPNTRALPLGVRVVPGDATRESTALVSFNFLVGMQAGTAYDHANIYLADATGNRISDVPLTSSLDHQLSAGIPLSTIAARLGGGAKTVRFIVQVLPKDGSAFFSSTSNAVQLNLTSTVGVQGNLSTNPDAHDRAIENYIYNHSAFPLETPTAWHQTFGSPAHDNNGFNAFDLNMNSDDSGQPIHSMAEGSVRDIGWYYDNTPQHNKLASHIDILSEADVNINGVTEHITWISKYLHMPMRETTDTNGATVYILDYNGGSITLKKGSLINQSQIIGGVGSVGAAGANHFHEDVHILKNGSEQAAVDFNPYLRAVGVASRVALPGFGGSEQTLDWSETAKEWAYAPLGLYYHRNLDGSEHYLAMTSGKEEIIYDAKKGIWVKMGVLNPTEKWDPLSKTFILL